jgi:V8-like Glu-specific endopeptidase
MSDLGSLGHDLAGTDLTGYHGTLPLPATLAGFDATAVVLLTNSLPLSGARGLVGRPLGPTSWETTPLISKMLLELADEIDRHITVIAPPDDLSDESVAVIRGLKMGIEPDPDSLNALTSELLTRRPILRITETGAEHPDPLTEFAAVWPSFVDKVHPLLRSIGLLGTVHHVGGRSVHIPLGTAWMVDDNLVVTNSHVVDAMRHHGWEEGSSVAPTAATVTFAVRSTISGPTATCKSVVASDALADLATIAIECDGTPPPKIERDNSSDGTSTHLAGLDVAVVGYPLPDETRNPLFSQLILGLEGGFQAAAPGTITSADNGIIRHNCSTTGGNSGSPVFDLATGSVVGVHRGGTYVLGSNLATPIGALEDLVG